MRVRATIMQARSASELEVAEQQVITVDEHGQITAIASAGSDQPDDGVIDVDLGDEAVLMPGLIDTHLHAPQWPQLGKALDLPLEQWLFRHTFPLEARYADTAYAQMVWDQMVPRLLALGTTTAVYYGSIHEEATAALAATCVRHGQRAFVGRVAMDHPTGTPDWYRDADPSSAVAASLRSIEAISALDDPLKLVQPMITPRFIPACTDASLTGLAELAASTGVRVQTHCSESDWEHAEVLQRHGVSDTIALDRFGLIRPNTVLAHATHLSSTDRATIVSRGGGVAHCPLSNAYFSERVFPVRAAIDDGLRLGLGSDVAGGSTASILAQCEHAVTASRYLESNDSQSDARIDVVTAFWVATGGGAELLDIPCGLIEVGRQFDAIAVDIGPGSSVSVTAEDTPAERFEKVVRTSAPSDIVQVWVAGQTRFDNRGTR